MIFPFLPTYVTTLDSRFGFDPLIMAGAVFSIQGLTMMVTSPIWGAVADRVGRKPMVLRAMIGGALVMWAQAYVTSIEWLLVLRGLQGILTGVVSANSALLASVTPKHRSGFALGALQTALTSGVALGPVIGGLLVDRVGYQEAFLVTAGLLGLGGALVQVGVSEVFTPPPQARRVAGMVQAWGHVLRTPGVAGAFWARFSGWMARDLMVPVLPLLVPFLVAERFGSATFTGLVFGASALTGTASAIALGRWGDAIGHKKILIGSLAVAAAVYLPMAFVTNGVQLLILNAIAGAAYGGVSPSISAILRNVTVEGEIGAAFGLDNAVVAASRAASPIAAVAIASAFGGSEWGYRMTFLFASITFLATLAIATRIRAPHRPA